MAETSCRRLAPEGLGQTQCCLHRREGSSADRDLQYSCKTLQLNQSASYTHMRRVVYLYGHSMPPGRNLYSENTLYLHMRCCHAFTLTPERI